MGFLAEGLSQRPLCQTIGCERGIVMATDDQSDLLFSSYVSGYVNYSRSYGALANGATASGTANGNNAALNVLSGGGTVSGATANNLGVLLTSGTLNAASIQSGGAAVAAANGTISGATVASGGSMIVTQTGTITDPTVQGGGVVAAGAFTAKGQSFPAGGVISGGTFDVGATEMVSAASAYGGHFNGTQLLLNGATASGGLFEAGGQQIIGGYYLSSVDSTGGTTTKVSNVSGTESGWTANTAVASGASIQNGGTAYVLHGGTAVSGTVGSGGKEIVESGGRTLSLTVSGGTEIIESGGVASGSIVMSGGTVAVSSGGTTSNTTLGAGGVELVSSGGTAYATTISNGGTLSATSGGILTGTTTVSGGGTLVLGGDNGNSTVNLAGTSFDQPASVVISAGTTNISETFTGWSDGDQIVFKGLTGTASSISFSDANHITFTLGGQTFTLNIVGVRDKFKFIDENGTTILETCFLTGTLVRMLSGYVPVEAIRPGDAIMVREDNTFVSREVKWVGKSKAVVRSTASYPDDAGYPVRIMKDALADGVPFKDMLVTPEHCLFIDGAFIPARMLVNGRNISYDTRYAVYDYYHVETAQHAVIEADGVLTETYLDTGNRKSFDCLSDSDVVKGYFEVSKDWVRDAAAPLVTSRDHVEPIYRAIESRNEVCLSDGEVRDSQVAWSHDPNLHLETAAGAVIRPVKQNGKNISFMLPPGLQKVFIVSRTARPVDAIGSFVDDRRELGVLIGNIGLMGGRNNCSLHAHLEPQDIPGWASYEADTARWTSGRAEVDLSSFPVDGFRMLNVEVVSTFSYREKAAEQKNSRSA